MDIDEAVGMLTEISELLETQVAELSPGGWSLPTPAEGWRIAEQIGHLLWTDEITLLAIGDQSAFLRLAAEVEASEDADSIDRGARERAALPLPELLASWRGKRAELRRALLGVDPASKIPWFGPPMRPITVATARTMETWAHALDVYDALGRELPATSALWAVARLGARTRGFAFRLNGLTVPEAPVRIELDMPGGERFLEGPEEADERITGSGWGFAAVVTQRRNIADVDLEAIGDGAREWMRIAQAFAGSPTAGPPPGQRVRWRAAGARGSKR